MTRQGDEEENAVIRGAEEKRLEWMIDKIKISFRTSERDLTKFKETEDFQCVRKRAIAIVVIIIFGDIFIYRFFPPKYNSLMELPTRQCCVLLF